MFALTRLGEGLLFIHGILIVAFVVGSLVLPWARSSGEQAPADQLARLVVTTAAGLSAIGFVVMALGFAVRAPPIGIFVGVSLLAVAIAARGRGALEPDLWRSRGRTLLAAWDAPAAIVYVGMLVLSVPAIVPNLGGDPTTYHLAYALDWVQAHGIVVDPFLRMPLYANDFLLFFAAAFALGANVRELPQLGFGAANGARHPGGGADLGRAVEPTRRFGHRARSGRTWSWPARRICAGWTPATSTCRWDATPCSRSSRCSSPSEPASADGWSPPIIGGFLIGMKPSFLALVPLLALVIALATRAIDPRRSTLFLVTLLFIACASPWYVRNVALVGDPIPPVVNLKLHGDDPYLTGYEWSQLEADFGTPLTARALLALPYRSFVDTRARDFREYGSTALMLLLYLPALWLLALVAEARKDDEAWIYAIGATGLIAYWLGTSTLLRYSLVFTPTLAVAIGVLASRLTDRVRSSAAWLVPALAALCAIPSPGARDLYDLFFLSHTRDMPAAFSGDRDYLLKFGVDYATEQQVVGVRRSHGLSGRVLTLMSQLGYYYRLDGAQNVGDWIGPASILRFQRAAMLGCAADFLARLDADTLVISEEMEKPRVLGPELDAAIAEQLRDAGFVPVPIAENARVFIRLPSSPTVPRAPGACDTDPNWFLPAAPATTRPV